MNKRTTQFCKKAVSVILCGIMVFSLAACQSNPEVSIIKNKDMDKLIEEAQNPGEDDVSMDALVDQYNHYQASIKDEKLGVTVNADAKVDIPKADKLSILRAEQAPISQEQLDAVRKALIGDAALYDIRVFNEQTKPKIESLIAYYRNDIAEYQGHPEWYSQEKIDEVTQKNQAKIDALQEIYDAAPDKVELERYPSDGTIQTVAELYAAYPDLYNWENSLFPEGSTLRAAGMVNDEYFLLEVINSENYGNKIRFSKDSVGVPRSVGVLEDDRWYWKEGEKPKTTSSDDMGNPLTGDQHPTDKVTLSMEDARKLADDFLKETGFGDFGFYQGDRYYETVSYFFTPETADKSGNDKLSQREYYVLTYTRVIDGAPITPGRSKNMGDFVDGVWTSKNWSTETITIKINDSGIVSFALEGQLAITETVVESTALKSFEDIQATFEKMVLITNASTDHTKNIEIDRVSLGYALVSEADSFDTGLLVPVWDFFGTSRTYSSLGLFNELTDDRYESVLTVNAIDDSIINRKLGY